jgi:hypothetical protein
VETFVDVLPQESPERKFSMMKVLYISSSSFSGSTLLSFILNTHASITTVGEMEGWEYEDTPFYCSCGEALEECPFYRQIQEAFYNKNLPFDFSHFGTAYRFTKNDRINRLLTEKIPFMHNPSLERLRDNIIRNIPPFSGLMRRFDKANHLFISTSLQYNHASVFVDASKNPYRLRHLRHVEGIKLYPLHLIRDLRGTIHSSKKNRGWDTALATRIWLREQANILHITSEFDPVLRVYYEDVCDDVNTSLARIADLVELPAEHFCGDFKTVEHHVLGNSMRLSGPSNIKKSESWKRELSDEDMDTIKRITHEELKHYKNDTLDEIVHHYLGT